MKSSPHFVPAVVTDPPDSANRVECGVCLGRFSATRRSRQPIVSSCGHSFCRHCASQLRNKCANCRRIFCGEKNVSLVAALEERKELQKQVKNLKAKLREAGIPVDEDVEESESDEDCGCDGECGTRNGQENREYQLLYTERDGPIQHVREGLPLQRNQFPQNRPLRRYINALMQTVEERRRREQEPPAAAEHAPAQDGSISSRRDQMEEMARRQAARARQRVPSQENTLPLYRNLFPRDVALEAEVRRLGEEREARRNAPPPVHGQPVFYRVPGGTSVVMRHPTEQPEARGNPANVQDRRQPQNVAPPQIRRLEHIRSQDEDRLRRLRPRAIPHLAAYSLRNGALREGAQPPDEEIEMPGIALPFHQDLIFGFAERAAARRQAGLADEEEEEDPFDQNMDDQSLPLHRNSAEGIGRRLNPPFHVVSTDGSPDRSAPTMERRGTNGEEDHLTEDTDW